MVALCLLLTASLAAAWGRKPPKEEEVKVALRLLSPSETVTMMQKYPEMFPSSISGTKDRERFARLFPVTEVTSAPLKRVFSKAQFYLAFSIDGKPTIPYLMATRAGKRYIMPGEFNRLLLDDGLRVTNKNMLALAEAFTVLAIGADYGPDPWPQITFYDAERIDTVIGRTTWSARVKVKYGEHVEVWHFASWHNGFGVVSGGTEASQPTKRYDLPSAEPPQKR
jgi:hypothetical protein